MDTTDTPLVTVVISTRERSDSVVKTVRAILLNDYPCFELRVVDQSENDFTETSLRPFLDNPHLRYRRTATKGLSTGLNLGISEAQSELIVITGDDCEVHKEWLRELVAAFAVDRRIGIVFGNVLPAPHDRRIGFIPAYVRDKGILARGISEKHWVGGTSACMGLRRSVWQRLGGFDQMLGVGAPLQSAEDTDLTIRALLSGYSVYETPRLTVIHHGFYQWEQCRILIHRYWYGTGAAFVKQLKCWRWSVAAVLLRLAWGWVFRKSRIAASLGNLPYRLLGAAAFVQGFAAGAITPIDRTTGHYISRRNDHKASP